MADHFPTRVLVHPRRWCRQQRGCSLLQEIDLPRGDGAPCRPEDLLRAQKLTSHPPPNDTELPPLSACSLSGRHRGRPARPWWPRTVGFVSSSGSNSMLSWVFAVDNMMCSGSPFASHRTWYLEPALPRSVGPRPVSSPPFSTAPTPRRCSLWSSRARRCWTARRARAGAAGPTRRRPATHVTAATRCAWTRIRAARVGLASGSRCRARTRSPLARHGHRSGPPTRTARRWSGRDQGFDQLPEPVFDPPLLRRLRHDSPRSTTRTGRLRSHTPLSFETRSKYRKGSFTDLRK